MTRIGKKLALVAACVSVMAGVAFAAEPAPKKAWWEGKTKQDRSVVFDVEKADGKLEVNEFNAWASAERGTCCRTQVEILVLTPSGSGRFLVDGRVSSKKQSCVTDRKVSVYFRRPGSDELIGSARATDEGFWSLRPRGLEPGTYYARVERKRIGKRDHRRVCKAATSPPRTLAEAR